MGITPSLLHAPAGPSGSAAAAPATPCIPGMPQNMSQNMQLQPPPVVSGVIQMPLPTVMLPGSYPIMPTAGFGPPQPMPMAALQGYMLGAPLLPLPGGVVGGSVALGSNVGMWGPVAVQYPMR